ERVVSRRVSAGSPLHVDLMTFELGDAPHHLVEVGHIVGNVVQAGRPGKDGEPMVPFVTAKKHHEIAEPVAYFETQNVDKELRGRLMVRRMQHDMTDALGERLAPLLHSRLAALDAAGNFEGQAVGGEEPEAVTAAQGRQLARLEDDLAARCTNPFEQLADVASIGRRERDDVYARFRAAAQTDAVELRAAFGGEMPHALEFADLAQPPFFSIEGSLRVEVRHAVAHVSYVRYSCHGPFSSFMTLS